jgi:hypothetical protein
MFNPIEEVYTDLKRSVRTPLSTTMHEDVLSIHNSSSGENAGARRGLFICTLDIAFQSISLERADNHSPRAVSFTTSALRRVALW